VPDPAEILRARLEQLHRTRDMLRQELTTLREDYAREVFGEALASAERAIRELTGAIERLRLPEPESSGNQVDVTKAQKQRRGEAVARAKAKHPVALAIVASQYKTMTAYARRRLRISQPALSRYIRGDLDCPPEVADKVREDFGLGDGVWKRPPRR